MRGQEKSGERDIPESPNGGSSLQASGPVLDRVIQAQIGDKLRAMYGELVEQPIPDRFANILDRLSKGTS